MPRLSLRPALSRAEVEEFAPVLGYSLFFPPLAEVDWAAREGIANFRLAWLGRELAGGLSVQLMGQWLGGRSVRTGAVRCVAVKPEHRSKGVARALLRALLEELRAQEVPLATLYPSTQAFYRLAGFERAGVRLLWRGPTAAWPAEPGGLELRRLGPDDEPAVRALYAERGRRSNGLLDRNDWLWSRFFRPILPGPYGLFGAFAGHRLEGYAHVQVEKVASSIAAGLIRVADLHAVTAAAWRSLLALLASHRSVVAETVVSAGPADPLWHLVANQDFRIDALNYWMLRLVDLPRALEARGYPPQARGEVHLAVRDGDCAANRGRWLLGVEDGKAQVRRGGRGSVKADIRGLSSLYTGYSSPLELQATGLVAGPPGELATLGALLAGPAPWMPDMF